jgi:NAD(P)-dependent dehydrogenase (short-subunit alcohol dehydrogenase family)
MAIETFEDKIAFITGGASGIGLGIARAFVGRGAKVVLADVRPDHLEEAVASFAAEGKADRAVPLRLDVADRAAFKAAADETDARFGGVDILVNNAGVGLEGPIRQCGYVDWDFGLGVNLGGVVNGIQTFLPRMIARKLGGHIVNTASLAPMTIMPSQYTIYAASKAAVVTLSEAMRADLAADGIGMTVLCPGFVKSNIHQAAQNRPERFRQGSGFAEAEQLLSQREAGDNWMEPDEVGRLTADAILRNDLYVITHGEFRNLMEARMKAILDATPHADFQFQ